VTAAWRNLQELPPVEVAKAFDLGKADIFEQASPVAV
jgi:hypothetical protein